ncbi:MAG: hypothetical protein HKP42_12825 [Maribacter sp.]|nr:hypothetical protein [Maribacter sp.]
MVIEDYNTLPVPEQWYEIFEYGKFLTTIHTEICNFTLYSLHNFYVEVLSDPLSNIPISNNALLDGDALEKYIKGIDVRGFESL